MGQPKYTVYIYDIKEHGDKVEQFVFIFRAGDLTLFLRLIN
jgi:hypothetical protein